MRTRSLVLGLLLLVALETACKTTEAVVVRSITFSGTAHVDATTLKSALATRETARVPVVGWQLPWTRSTEFDRGTFDADLQRITAFYGDRGYPDARVTSADVTPTASRKAVDIAIAVQEGDPIRVSAVQLNGFDVLPDDRLALLRSRLPLTAGAPRDRQLLTASRDAALNTMRDEGYPFARVSVTENSGPGQREATVMLTAEPGPLAHFGAVEVVGSSTVSPRVVERQLLYKSGDLYRRSLVQESQRRLYALELFQFVNIETLDADQQSATVRTRVTVTDGKHHRINLGAGYGTEEKARVDAEYRQLNFLGGGRSAGAHARWSSLDRGLRADVNQPYFFTPHLSLGGEAQQWYTFTPAYHSTVTAAKATLTHRATQRFSWALSVGSEKSDSAIEPDVLNDKLLYADLIALGLDPTTRTQSGTLSALGFDLERNTTDNILNAHRGTQLALHLEESGRLLPGTFDYYAVSADGRHYQPVGRRLVLANRIQLGAINAFGSSPAQVPFSKKYFLGGASSLRGWGRYEVSPLSGSGLPLGGNSLLAASSEARIGLGPSTGVVAFVDAGNVWASGHGFNLSDLRYAAGAGFRYDTPVGPIRIDVGYQLNPIPGLEVDGAPQARRWRLHFSIGQAF